MARPLFLVVSDLHIRNGGEWLFASRPFIRNDLLVAMKQVEDFILELRPKGVIICGDIFHSPVIQSGDLYLMLRLINACKKVKAQIIYVQGQHDRAEPMFFSSLDPSAIHLHNRKIEFEGVSLVGLDFIRRGLMEYLDKLPDADIFVTHQCWKKQKKSLFGDILVEDLCKNYKLTISGDIHTHCIANLEDNQYITPDDGSTCRFKRAFISPGSVCYQKIDDVGPYGIFVIEDSLSVTSYHLQSRQIIQLRFHTDEQVKRYIKQDLPAVFEKSAKLHPDISKPIFVVRNSAVLPSLEDFRMAIGEKGFMFATIEKVVRNMGENSSNSDKIDDLFEEVLKQNIFANEVRRLFRAGTNGELLNKEISLLCKELEDVAAKEAGVEELLST